MIAIPVAAFMGPVAMSVGPAPQARCNDFGPGTPMIAIPTADDCGSLQVPLAAHHHRPNDTGGFVGQRDRGNFGRFARQQSADPLAVAGWSMTRMAQRRDRASGEQAADVFVAARWSAPSVPCRRSNSAAASSPARRRTRDVLFAKRLGQAWAAQCAPAGTSAGRSRPAPIQRHAPYR